MTKNITLHQYLKSRGSSGCKTNLNIEHNDLTYTFLTIWSTVSFCFIPTARANKLFDCPAFFWLQKTAESIKTIVRKVTR